MKCSTSPSHSSCLTEPELTLTVTKSVQMMADDVSFERQTS